jgi:glycerol-3-phosphate cytidylyltransferase
MSKSKHIGYTTMTADMLHTGHLNLLKTAKSLCDVLIVGLTTNDLAQKQKRAVLLDFVQRKQVLESLSFVDAVVEHTGETKSEAYNKIKFDYLFIGDDYVNNVEYTQFETEYPHVKVFYLPRTSDISTTDFIEMFEDRIVSKIDVLGYGIGGAVLKISLDQREIIVKSILLGYNESESVDCSDVYNIASPPPRNWKTGNVIKNIYPMISGVNGYREILIHEDIKHFAWNPFIKSKLVYTNKNPVEGLLSMSNIELMQYQRLYPYKTHWILQRFCGMTLSEFMYKSMQSNDGSCEVIFNVICQKIKYQIDQLRALCIIHGDLHPNNICIDDKLNVSFIDFGWCLSKKFKMDIQETLYLEKCLKENFDWNHYLDSLHSFGLHIYNIQQ